MRFDVKKPRSTELALQITSMADCFIIILVFLLKSVATSSITVNPSAGLKLPQGSPTGELEEALTVEISEKAVQIENGLVNELTGFRFKPSDLGPNGVSSAIETALDTKRKRQELIAKSNPDVKINNKILVVADQKTPYVTLKSVLAAASIHGFSDFKLVVAKKE